MTWSKADVTFPSGAGASSVGIEIYNNTLYTFGGQDSYTSFISTTYWANLDDILNSDSVSWSSYNWQDDPLAEEINLNISDGFRVTSSTFTVNSTVYIAGAYPIKGLLLSFDLINQTQISLSNYTFKIGYPSNYISDAYGGCLTGNNTHLFYLGGETVVDQSFGSYSPHDTFYMYDIINDIWYDMPNIASGSRSYLDCSYDDQENVIWIFGGWDGDYNFIDAEASNTFQYFDLVTGNWSAQFDMDYQRASLQAPLLINIPLYDNINNSWNINSGHSMTILLGGYEFICISSHICSGAEYVTDVGLLNTTLSDLVNSDDIDDDIIFNGKLPEGVDYSFIFFDIEWIGKDGNGGTSSVLNEYHHYNNVSMIEEYSIWEYGLIVVGGFSDGERLSDILYLNLTYTVPTMGPTTMPTELPTVMPTIIPTGSPSTLPSTLPTPLPSPLPTNIPTNVPSLLPTTMPTIIPTGSPSVIPTTLPTNQPSNLPTNIPTDSPSSFPSESQGMIDDD